MRAVRRFLTSGDESSMPWGRREGVVLEGVVWCGVIRCRAVWCGALSCSAVLVTYVKRSNQQNRYRSLKYTQWITAMIIGHFHLLFVWCSRAAEVSAR